jgi:hypothetical protein
MVFIIGYVFGNFSTKPVLRTITKIASILAIVLFISANIFFFRFAAWNHGYHNGKYNCSWHYRDSTSAR